MRAVQTDCRGIGREEIVEIIRILQRRIPVGFNHHKQPQKWDGFDAAPDIPVIQQELQSAKKQLGTLGGGNHFLEIQIDQDGLYDFIEASNKAFEIRQIAESGKSFDENMATIQDKIDQTEAVLEARKALFETLTPEEQVEQQFDLDEISKELERYKFAKDFLTNTGREFFADFVDIFNKTNGNIAAGVEAVARKKDELTAAMEADAARKKRIAESANKAAKEFNDKFKEAVTTSSLPPIADKMEQLAKLEQEIRDLLAVMARNAGLDDLPDLLDAFDDAMAGIDRQKKEFLDAQNKNRDRQIFELQFERAKLEKDVTKALAMLRQERNDQLNETLNTDFDKSGITDAKELARIDEDRLKYRKEYNMETDRLLDALEKELTTVEDTQTAAEEIALKQSERNKLEESITNELIEQVKSMKDAVAISEFLRAESRKRVRDAANAAEAEEKAEARLLKLTEERAAIQARGGDTSAIDAKIRKLSVRVETAQQVADLRAGEAGFGERKRDFAAELKAASEAGRKRGIAERPGVMESLFPIVNLFAEFARRSGQIKFPAPQQGGGMFPAPVPVPQGPNVRIPAMPQTGGPVTNNYNDNREINIDIKGNVDINRIAREVKDIIARENLGIPTR